MRTHRLCPLGATPEIPSPLCSCRHNNYLGKILNARVYEIAQETPLQFAPVLSSALSNRVLLKREDLQPVFSFKIRGAYNKISQLSREQRAKVPQLIAHRASWSPFLHAACRKGLTSSPAHQLTSSPPHVERRGSLHAPRETTHKASPSRRGSSTSTPSLSCPSPRRRSRSAVSLDGSLPPPASLVVLEAARTRAQGVAVVVRCERAWMSLARRLLGGARP